MEKQHDNVQDIIKSYGGSLDSLTSILQHIQSEYNYLPEDALGQVARSLGLPLIQVYGVATFFKTFNLKPCGRLDNRRYGVHAHNVILLKKGHLES